MQVCSIRTLDCTKKEDQYMFLHLQSLASAQKQHFLTIFPWEAQCEKGSVLMFVSLQYSYQAVQTRHLLASQRASVPRDLLPNPNMPTKICGWMTVYAGTSHRQNYLYISTLSSRTPTDPTYKGIGAALLQAVEQHARDNEYDFIYLLPLSDVIGFYQKQGYSHMDPAQRIPYMAKSIHGLPSRHMVSDMLRKMEEEAHQSTEKHALKEISYDLDPDEREKLWSLINEEPSRLYEILAVYQENESIDDIREWLELY